MTLDPGGIIAWLLVGLIAGWLAGKVTGSSRGLVSDLVLGLIGAFVGGFIFGLLGISGNAGFFGSIVVATIGAVILISLSRVIYGKR
ncbi:MAG: GlsB/YeaQ/YmgE family stress response membrane protein [Chloroflexus aggregans]|uniref:GlsB/YeaQ/YmgE family stress response membrane protein n=1 Tax=Chloroflexus aggregans TaxID=152260 RepID=A0A2J6WT94_9CHLR|nr:MAG: GlsB/YeaQ/YmgE family stress response membrane protein [Chloroflexus aggregans]